LGRKLKDKSFIRRGVDKIIRAGNNHHLNCSTCAKIGFFHRVDEAKSNFGTLREGFGFGWRRRRRSR